MSILRQTVRQVRLLLLSVVVIRNLVHCHLHAHLDQAGHRTSGWESEIGMREWIITLYGKYEACSRASSAGAGSTAQRARQWTMTVRHSSLIMSLVHILIIVSAANSSQSWQLDKTHFSITIIVHHWSWHHAPVVACCSATVSTNQRQELRSMDQWECVPGVCPYKEVVRQ